MAQHIEGTTTFEIERVIEPIYEGGDVRLGEDGRILATCLGEDVLLVDLNTGNRLARISGDDEPVTSVCMTPSASHLLICSRSLSMRTYALNTTSSLENVNLQLLRTVKAHTAPIVVTTIDRTGSLFATGASDGEVKVWDIRAGYTTHTLHGHGSVISSLLFFSPAVSRKGKTAGAFSLAAGSEDGKIRIWNLETRKTTALVESHVSVVSDLDFRSDINVLLSASRDRTVMLWDCATWQTKLTIPVLESVEAAGFINGDSVYTGGEKGQLRVWSASTGQCTWASDHSDSTGITQMICHSTLPFLLVIRTDQVLQLLSKPESETAAIQSSGLSLIRQISGNHDEIIDFEYLGREKSLLAVATNVEDIRILWINSGASDGKHGPRNTDQYFGYDVASLKGHEDIVICLDVDWSGHWLVSGAKDNTAKLWRIDLDNASFTCYATLTGHAESIGAVSIANSIPSADSAAYQEPLEHPPSIIITGSQDKTIKRWVVGPSQKDGDRVARALYTRKAHEKDINAIDINHNSTLFASASQDRSVKIWTIEDGETVGVLRGHRRGVWSVKFSPHGTPSILSGGTQASSSRGFVLTGSGDKTVKIWSLSDYSCLRTFEGHTNSVLKVVWMRLPATNRETSDGDHERENEDQIRQLDKRSLQVASAGGDGLIKVWDVKSGESATTLDNHTDRVWALTAHPKTNGLISGGGDGVITFWKDTTSTNVAIAAAASTARVEQDQELQNYIRVGSYREAIVLALQLDHPARLLSLFTSVTNTYPREEHSLSGVKAVDEVLANLGDEQLIALLGRIRDWNANAKTAPVAQRVLWTIFRSCPPNRLLGLEKNRKNGVKDILDAIRAYTDRHYGRMEELIDESHLVDYTLQEMAYA